MSINVWALKRDTDIKHLLLELSRVLGLKAFDIHAPDDGHPQSIELLSKEDPRLKAYIYTFSQAPNDFGLVLDYPMLEDNDLSSMETAYEEIKLDYLIDLLAAHFDIAYTT